MKKILLLLMTVCLISCEEALDKLTMFDVKNTTEFTIPSTTIIDLPFALPTPEVDAESNQDFSNNNSRKDLIESAILTRLNLTIDAPADANFDFLNKVEIFINAEGLDEVRIASIDDIPENGSASLDLMTEDTELREYLKKDRYSLNIRATMDKTINESYTIKVANTIFIDAKILGI